ncbi:4-alpha-glucanotransferase dpe1, chloroplastic/amyloplastic [Trebouxia sp. C0010 RCD-2024]
MLCAGTASLYKTIKPQGRTFFRRSHLTANLPVTVAGRVRQQKALIHSQRLMQPQCTAVVDNPLTAGVESNGTGGYQHKYKELNTGDSLAIEYADDTAAAPKNRRAGVILHPTSLPGPYGTGEIGKEAFKFVDWVASTGMQLWQVLPLVPPEEQYWSPYAGQDALCGSTLMIAIDELIEDGLLDKADKPKKVPVAAADFVAVRDSRIPLLKKAADRLLEEAKFSGLCREMDSFRSQNPWVEDSALFFCLIKLQEDTKEMGWWQWPLPIRKREPAALADATGRHKTDIERFIALQYLFDRQWKAVKAYANSKNVKIVGDMPIYVGAQSADVWAHQELFELDDSGAAVNVAGVPPDAFSETGQLWGNPLYDWPAHEREGYRWWAQRLGRSFQLYDETRVDHFRGFAGYWSVDAKAETAMGGVWKKGPGAGLFKSLNDQLGYVAIIAEDLGVITTDVNELRKAIGAPGMVVLQFAWGSGATNTHIPHNHYENSVCYPGTHDNETTVGWWNDSAQESEKEYIKRYLHTSGKDIAGDFMRESFKSVSKTSIVMLQDIMRLDNSARMNLPGSTTNNWSWRVGEGNVWKKLGKQGAEIKRWLEDFDRTAEIKPPTGA